jgi:hypothetical protein
MRFDFDDRALAELVRSIIKETLAEIGWPEGRVALTENEAAVACGVGRHVLRDLRLKGRIHGVKLGKRIVYTRQQLLAALSETRPIVSESSNVEPRSRR